MLYIFKFFLKNEVSKTICFLVSDGAKYITGQNIKVDGGLTKYIG